MHVNRGLVFWGVALITAGIVALLIQSGAIADEAARDLWRFWPIALIIIGVAIIAARTPFALVATLAAALVVGVLGGSLVAGWPSIGIGCGGETNRSASENGSFGSTGEVALEFNCGDLSVSMASGSDWSIDARYVGDAPTIQASEDTLRVEAETSGVSFFGANSRQEWDLQLPSDPELDFGLNANAASSDLDLSNATFSRLSIDANAGEVNLILDGASASDFRVDANAGSVSITGDDSTSIDGSVGMNAGSLELCLPENVGLAITIEDANVTFSHNLDERGLTRQGDTWRSGEGTSAVTLDVEGNATSFELNPDGGCS